MIRRVAAGGVLSAILTASFAASATPQDVALAEELFDVAQKQMAEGKVDEACPKLAESLRLDPQIGTLLNLAMCHERQGKTASAWAEFVEVAGRAARAQQQDRAVYARAQASRLQPNVARARLELAADAMDATVVVDGREIGRAALAVALPLDPGPHEIAASAGGKSWKQSFVIEPGASITVTIASPETASSAHPAREASTSSSPLRPIGLVTAAVGVVAIGTGAYFGVHAKSLADASGCNGTVCGPGSDPSQLDDAKSSGNLSTVLFVAGSVLTATGIGLFVLAPRSSTVATAIVTPGGGACVVRGSF